MTTFTSREEAIARYSVELRRFGVHETLISARAAILADRHLQETAHASQPTGAPARYDYTCFRCNRRTTDRLGGICAGCLDLEHRATR